MDLGTANIIIMHNDKIIVNEPSIIAISNKSNKMVAVVIRPNSCMKD